MGQYVGARYVPKFMGLYNATQAYEALCVVDNGMGTSYITKVSTPAGTPLTDTDYYAVYGASSGAIINLQNQIGDLTDLNTTAQDSLVNAINEVDADIQALTNNLPLVNVMNYGAVGDGVADDYNAFNDALTYCKANNLKLYVPQNTYNLSQFIFTDEVYVESNLGAYPNGKLVYSKSIGNGSLNKISSLTLDTATVFGSTSI